MIEWDPYKAKAKEKKVEKTQDELASALLAFAHAQNARIDAERLNR